MAKRPERNRRQFLVNFENRKNDKGKRNNPFHFIFFDTETKQETSIKRIGKKDYKTVVNTLDFGYACYWNRETDETDWLYFETIPDFHRWVSKILTLTKKKTVWMIAHNITFDNIITDIWKLFIDQKKFDVDFIHAKGMVFLQSLTRRTGKEKKTTQKKVMLVNNGNIFPTTLKNIGETIGLEKLDMDFDDLENVSREDFQIYGRRDVEILLEFWKQWIQFLEENELGNIKYTISSQSMESFKKRFCDHYIMLDDDMDTLAFERLGYYGGRTEIFFKGKVLTPVYYNDVNSMYPFAMWNKRFPTEHKFTKVNPSIEQILHYINDRDYLIMAECYIDTKENNCYPVKSKNSLMFPVGKFKTYLPTPEVLKAIEYGDLVKFGDVAIYKADYIFKEYVEFFYNERLKKKAEGNKQEAMLKLFLNSLYGKFGQMMDSWIKTTIEEIKMLDPNFDFDDWIMDEYKIPKIILDGINVTPAIRFIGGELQLSGEKEESKISFPAIAGHVTSYARLMIWDAIKWCKDNDVKAYYTDTDSIMTNKPLPPEMMDKKELGKYDLEKYFEHGVEFINLKNYSPLTPDGFKIVENDKGEKITMYDEVFNKESKVLKGSTWKMKGVPKSAQMLDENTFIAQEWGGLPKQEYYKKFGRKDGEFWVIYKTKHNKGNINKGVLTETGDINPFVLNDFD